MNTSELYFINLAKSAVLNQEPDMPNAEVDWDYIWDKAKEQSISGLIASVILKLPENTQPDSLMKWEKIMFETMSMMARKSGEFCKIYELLKKQNIKVIALKGIILKEYYPIPELRTMGDFDIFVKQDNIGVVKELFENEGYMIKQEDFCYIAQNSNCIWEIFSSLVEELRNNTDYYDELFWENAKINESGIYTLKTEHAMAHLIVHFGKHLLYQGAGIRQLLDIAVFADTHNINYKEVELICKKQQYYNVYQYVLAVLDEYFNIKIEHEEMDTDEFMKVVLSKGVFGALSDNVMMHQTAKQEGKIIQRLFFPKPSMIKHRYTYLEKHPYLLPIAWVHRIIYAKRHYGYRYKKLAGDIKGSVDFAKERDSYVKKLRLDDK